MAEIIENINPARIRWCCDEIGISLDDLAVEVRIPVTKLEQVKLTFKQLQKMADYFGYGVLFFLESAPARDESIYSPQFRTLSRQSVTFDNHLNKFIRQIEQHRDFYLSLLEDMDEVPKFEIPVRGLTIADTAERIRQWLGLKDNAKYDFSHYRKCIEQKGILVFQSMGYNGKWQLKHDKVVGFCIEHPQVPCIFIKKTSLPMQTFTLFHELGHLLLHGGNCIDNERNLSSQQTNNKERDANQFAAACLLPSALLKQALDNIPQDAVNYDKRYTELAQKLGISVEVIVVSLLENKAISQDSYEQYKAYKKEQRKVEELSVDKQSIIPRKYRHLEPLQIFGNHYVGTILESIHRQHITIVKASDYLDRLKIPHIRKLENDIIRY